MSHDADHQLILPNEIVTKSDIARLVSELESVDSEHATAEVREGLNGQKTDFSAISPSLSVFLERNSLSLDSSHQRSEIIHTLRTLKHEAPVVHFTFAGPTDRESLQKLTAWMRENTHPHAIVETGIQPSLIAGVYVRTPNKVHDLSLRSVIKEKRSVLVSALEELRGA